MISPPMYRFRPAYALLDGFHELERQEIHFSTASELNDPMEGYRDVAWQGDAWRNLFRHYGRLLAIATRYLQPQLGLRPQLAREPCAAA